jgi:monoterpene epsilon-lactone hydrolase
MDHDEIEAVRALLSSKPRPVGWAERRQRIDEVGSVWPVAGDVTLAAVDLGGVPGEWSIVPGSDASRVIMFFHGGGYCSGSIRSHRRMVSEAGRAAGMRTLAVGYRLAPENKFPAALEDAATAWRFLREQGVAAEHVAIGGDSAGGGLTVALINRLRDGQEQLPACAWLTSPWTDLAMSGSTLATRRRRSAHSQGLSRRAGRCLPPCRNEPKGPEGICALCRLERLPADADPGGIGGDTARGCHAFRSHGRRSRCGCDA